MKNMTIRRALILLSMGGATFGFAAFGPSSFGCNYANNSDYEAMFAAVGDAVIQRVSDNFFNFGTDWNAFVRTPATDFAQSSWGNWLDSQIADDLPNNSVFAR